MKRCLHTVLLFLAVLMMLSCKDKNRIHPDPVTMEWNFNSGAEGWTGDFAEYPAGMEASYGLMFQHDTLPDPLDHNQGALKLSGINRNSDLFMFAKKKVTGLVPNTAYYITFNVEFATNEPSSSSEAEVSPGSLVYIGVGASIDGPVKTLDENNNYTLNIDKCDGNIDGEDMFVIGDFSNDTDQPVYVLKTLENEIPFHCITDEKGELWIIIGTESENNDAITVFYNKIRVYFF